MTIQMMMMMMMMTMTAKSKGEGSTLVRDFMLHMTLPDPMCLQLPVSTEPIYVVVGAVNWVVITKFWWCIAHRSICAADADTGEHLSNCRAYDPSDFDHFASDTRDQGAVPVHHQVCTIVPLMTGDFCQVDVLMEVSVQQSELKCGGCQAVSPASCIPLLPTLGLWLVST